MSNTATETTDGPKLVVPAELLSSLESAKPEPQPWGELLVAGLARVGPVTLVAGPTSPLRLVADHLEWLQARLTPWISGVANASPRDLARPRRILIDADPAELAEFGRDGRGVGVRLHPRDAWVITIDPAWWLGVVVRLHANGWCIT